MVEAVLFDLYETVVTEFNPHWRDHSVLTAGEQLGLRDEVFRAEWRARQQGRYTGAYKDYRSVLREICRSARIEVNEDLIERLHAERLQAKAVPFRRIERDVLDALERLRYAGIQIGLISNCAPEEIDMWERSILCPLFDDAVFSFRVGLAKPDPRIYLLACERLNVWPKTALFVGDGGSDELTGAERVGLTPYKAVWFLARWPDWKTPGRSREPTAYPVLRTPSKLVEIVVTGREADGYRMYARSRTVSLDRAIWFGSARSNP